MNTIDEDDSVTQRAELLQHLTELVNGPAFTELHEVEQAIAKDILSEPRHIKCGRCLKLLQALITKMTVDR